jgi:xanthine dehydrogenase accessory factor
MKLPDIRIVILGGGEQATGAIRRLHLCGFSVYVLELHQPRCVRRTVCAASAIYEAELQIEEMTAVAAVSVDEATLLLKKGKIPVLGDPEWESLKPLKPRIVVDGRLAKEPSTIKHLAPITIGLGPGFVAPSDCDFVVETNRGPWLGRVIDSGIATPNTGVPAPVSGQDVQRIVRASRSGIFQEVVPIGKYVEADTMIGTIDGIPVRTKISGLLRGIIHSGIKVVLGEKVADVDPRNIPELATRVSDKANAIGGGVVEAVFRGLRRDGTL